MGNNNKLFAIFFAFFLFLGVAVGQSLSEGSVVGLQVEPNPLNSTFIYDFELCCGYPSGAGGFLGNGFAYVEGEWTLFYKFPQGKNGYSFSGTIDTWYTPQAISNYCTIQSGTLKDGEIMLGDQVVGTGFVAEYSQLFCQRGGVYWLGPGGLTVHAQ
jgi:hypothetical protein